MNLSWTLSRYLGRHFFLSVLAAFGITVCLAFLVDFIELLRRTSGRDEIGLGLVLSMGLLNLPRLSTETLPFAVLFGAMASFLRLTRNNELIVARAAGVSVWQFLGPAIIVALVIGGLFTTVYNPVSAALAARFEQLEAEHIRGRTSLLAVSSAGLWLRQGDADGNEVVHALRASDRGQRLEDVIIFRYGPDNRYLGRIDARSARLVDGYWSLDETWITEGAGPPRYFPDYRLQTSLTLNQVQDSFASPETISFWDLPRFIALAEQAGFSTTRYRLHWHSIAAMPALLAAMVLVAAIFSLRLSRLGGLGQLVVGGVMAGFVLFFLSDLTLALGTSGLIPPALAAWAPSIVAAMIGLTMVFHLEDG